MTRLDLEAHARVHLIHQADHRVAAQEALRLCLCASAPHIDNQRLSETVQAPKPPAAPPDDGRCRCGGVFSLACAAPPVAICSCGERPTDDPYCLALSLPFIGVCVVYTVGLGRAAAVAATVTAADGTRQQQCCSCAGKADAGEEGRQARQRLFAWWWRRSGVVRYHRR